MKLNRGFTLAEVLITLSIIGVVAAITIPALVTNVDLDRKQADAVVKKTITAINDATKQIVMLETTSHKMNDVGCANDDCIRDLYGKYLQYTIVCSSGSQDECLDGASATETTSYLDFMTPVYAADPDDKNSGTGVDFSGKSLAILADGTLVGFKYDSTCAMTTKTLVAFEDEAYDIKNTCIAVSLDVNGAKKPNKAGKDRYQFPVGKLGVKITPKEQSTTP